MADALTPLRVPDFKGRTVVVAGDVMLDRYWLGPTERVSPEAPVPVVHVGEGRDVPGGAANVAVNLAALGTSVRLLGVTGNDEAGARLAELTRALGIDTRMIQSEALPTITKLRVMSRSQQMIRLDFEQRYQDDDVTALGPAFGRALEGAQLAVLSDYAKGTLADAPGLIAMARKAGVPVLVDPKDRDYGRYRHATLVTPNRAEFEQAAGPCESEAILAERASRMLHEYDIAAMLVTLGERGMLLVTRDQPPLHLPAEAREVFDVTGAGDTVIAVAAAGLAADLTLPEAAALANTAAGLVVAKRGTASVSEGELRLAAHQRGIPGPGIVTPAQLASLVKEARERGQRVVMTNGCFDIIHAGHVAYLAEARALGHRLVVAVNADESVRRLKGDGRPVNTLADRMSVLAALAAVDWVVPFEEDTPERLICDVGPDILVKGGDYRLEDIAGAGCVQARGGEVKVLPFRPGRSSSNILKALSKAH